MDLLAVLDRFVNRVAERWPTATDKQGQPLVRVVRNRYEGPRALLSDMVSPAAVSWAPAELVEELLILACVLRSHGLTSLERAVDRALAQARESPARRLAYVWPEVPGAKGLQWALRQNLREGGRLPDGGGYREARKIFVLLNRFDVGPPLVEQFLQLCREVEVEPVRAALERALAAGRTYVTLAFLREAVRRQRVTGGTGREDAPAGSGQQVGRRGTDPAGPARGAGAAGDAPMTRPAGGVATDEEQNDHGDVTGPEARPTPAGSAGVIVLPDDAAPGVGLPSRDGTGRLPERELVRYWLQEYGIVGSPLQELPERASLAQARAWMLYLERQDRLDDEARRGTLVNRLRAGDEPPRQYRWWALLLPPVDPVEEAMLEADYRERRWGSGEWSEDVLEVIGAEWAERWLEARGKRPALER